MTPSRTTRSARRIVPAATVPACAAAALAAPSGAAASSAVHVTVDGHGIHAPGHLRAGLTTFRVTSRTGGVSSLQMARLNEGVTHAQIAQDSQTGPVAVFAHVTGKGGISHLDHKGWLTAAGTLNALGAGQQAWFLLHGLHGRYLLLDYLPMVQGAAPAPLVVFHRFA